MRRLRVRLSTTVPLTVRRTDVTTRRFAYLLVAQRPIEYPFGRSPVVYIGNTSLGLARLASKATEVGPRILRRPGLFEFDLRVVTCPPRRKVQTWRKLERALLLRFRERYGEVPLFNRTGRRMQERDEFDYFLRDGIDSVFTAVSRRAERAARRK